VQVTRPYIVGQICARGGSKGVPRKNLRTLGGKPLVAWSIECALQCPSLDRVIVSTEDDQIASVARDYGAEVPFMRPAELARDDSPEWHVWQHTVRTLDRCDVLVTLPPTSPLRAVQDVEACLARLEDKRADICVTVTPAGRNPYFNMVTIEDGWAELAIKGARNVVRRQDTPEVFDLTTVAYAARSEFVLRADSYFDGRVCAVVVPRDRAIDIDSELDLAFAEVLVERKADERYV